MDPVPSTSTALILPPSPPLSTTLTATARPAPLLMNDSDRSSWQVVLVTSQRKLVLYNRKRNLLHVASTQQWGEEDNDDTWEDVEQIGRTSTFLGDDDDDDEERNDHGGRRTPTMIDSNEQGRQMRMSEDVCPLCRRSLLPARGRQSRRRTSTSGAHGHGHGHRHASDLDLSSDDGRQSDSSILGLISGRRRAKDSSYFALLSHANSRTNSPRVTTASASASAGRQSHGVGVEEPAEGLASSTLNTGYFESFFETLQLLGRGGAGSVWLVRHVLNGEALGLYACKKVAVGDSAPSLLRILREVHLLEAVQHPNIVIYHHAWVESAQLSAYSPSVPTLHILMAYANGGSLASFIDGRRGSRPSPETGMDETPAQKKERHRLRKLGAVHLLRIDEIVQLARDVTMGLGFLHQRNILHLDLKAENVLLHWEEDALLPIAKLSDFGNATSEAWDRERTGGSGTLMYTAPESFEFDPRTGRLHNPDRATDQWALGLIVHLLCFFTLPYHNQDDAKRLEEEIKIYPGFFASDAQSLDHGTRHDLPSSLLTLISRLVHRTPGERPNCEKVLLTLGVVLRDEVTSSSGEDEEEVDAQMGLIKSLSPPPRAGFGVIPRRRLLSDSAATVVPAVVINDGAIVRDSLTRAPRFYPSYASQQRIGLAVVGLQVILVVATRASGAPFSLSEMLLIVGAVMAEVLVPRVEVWTVVSLLGVFGMRSGA